MNLEICKHALKNMDAIQSILHKHGMHSPTISPFGSSRADISILVKSCKEDDFCNRVNAEAEINKLLMVAVELVVAVIVTNGGEHDRH